MSLLKAALILSVLAAPGFAQITAQMINLSCLEALTAVGEPRLTGVFSFIAEKDSEAAFSDLLARDKKMLKKYLAKVEADLKLANAVAEWDSGVLKFTLSLFSSPLGPTLDNPGKKVLSRMAELAGAPKIPLAELSSRRAKP